MDKRHWLPVAKQLQAGYKVRIPCCKADNSLLVSYDTKYWACYCFRCGFTERVAVGQRSIEQIRQDTQDLYTAKINGVAIPSDFTQEIPEEARVWYLKAGLSTDDMLMHCIGYSPKYRRVVLLVYSAEGTLDALQMRAVHPYQKPKYLNPVGPKTSAAVFIAFSDWHAEELIVVEDILSAIKLHKAGFSAAAILGTKTTDSKMIKLLDHSNKLCWWMDSDSAGRKCAKEGVALTELYGGTARRVESQFDPKMYNADDIRRILQ